MLLHHQKYLMCQDVLVRVNDKAEKFDNCKVHRLDFHHTEHLKMKQIVIWLIDWESKFLWNYQFNFQQDLDPQDFTGYQDSILLVLFYCCQH